MSVAAPPELRSPYKGLAPFEDSEQDALFFFGRERECEVAVANLLASKLTVLYGPSGVGKSSMLRAAVVRRLRELEPDARVIVLADWAGDPELPLPEGDTFLILDQFEEYFLYHGEGLLLEELPELLALPRVHMLISLRDDSLARLDAFQARIPNVFANRLRIDHLDRAAARAAIVGPIDRWNEIMPSEMRIGVEAALVAAVLDEAATAPAGNGSAQAGLIEAPYLQLVLERVWEEEREAGSRFLRAETLERLGGARAIVGAHLQRTLGALGPRDAAIAASALTYLVTPSRTKIAQSFDDLVGYTDEPPRELRAVLELLAAQRILRVASTDGGEGGRRYEIFHDVLAEPVLAWRRNFTAHEALDRERRRRRRVTLFAVAALLLAAAATALAVFALTQRSAARSQARQAHAGQLEANALLQLGVDPGRSLLLALDAARLSPGDSSETVLRDALIASRLRAVLSARGPVRAVAYSPDGAVLAAGSSDGRTRIYDAAGNTLRGTITSGGSVTAVAFSPDGSRLAVADDSGRVTVADARTARRLLVVSHRAAVTSVVFDPAGRRLLTASADGTAKIWNAATGRLVRTLRHPGPVMRARFGPDGVVATVGADRAGHQAARLFDERTGKLERVLETKGVWDAEFSPDGRLLAVANHDGITRVYDARTGTRLHVLDDGGKGTMAVAFSPDSAFLATAADDGAVRVWRLADGSRFFFFPVHKQAVVALAWSRDGSALADASLDGNVTLYEIVGNVPGTVVATLAGHTDAVTTLAFAPNGKMIATGSEDGTARVWDGRLSQDLVVIGKQRAPVTSASFAPGDRRVVSAGADAAARIWDVRTRRLQHELRLPAAVVDARFSLPDGRTVATGSTDGTVAIWNAATGARLSAARLRAAVNVVRFSPDGRLLAAGDAHGDTVLLRASNATRTARMRRSGPVVSLAFSGDGTVLLSATRTGLIIWDVAGARALHAIDVPGGVVRAALSPDASLVATAGADDRARIYDAHTSALLHVLPGHTAPLTDVVFFADGRSLVTTSVDARPRVWNAQTGALEQVLVGHFGTVSTAAVSPDGRWIATAGPLSAGLWPTATARLLFYLRGPTALLTSISFTADGHRILTSSMDGTVRIYTCEVCVDLDGLVALARARLERTARALTPAQRARYLSP